VDWGIYKILTFTGFCLSRWYVTHRVGRIGGWAHCTAIPKSRALTWGWLAEGELTFTPSSVVESTDEIPGRSDSESNYPVWGSSFLSISDIGLLLV